MNLEWYHRAGSLVRSAESQSSIFSHSKIQNRFSRRKKRIHCLKVALSRSVGRNTFKTRFTDEREMINTITLGSILSTLIQKAILKIEGQMVYWRLFHSFHPGFPDCQARWGGEKGTLLQFFSVYLAEAHQILSLRT
jgi:transposase